VPLREAPRWLGGGPGLRRDDVICSEGAIIIDWITASFAEDEEGIFVDHNLDPDSFASLVEGGD
jgi:hypothetical protein